MPLYWRFVLENRDATLYPPCTLRLLDAGGETVGPDTPPTHGYEKWQGGRIWLAPPGHELAEVRYSLGAHSSGTTRTIGDGKLQVDFSSPEGYHSLLFNLVQVKPDGEWHVLKFDPGLRGV